MCRLCPWLWPRLLAGGLLRSHHPPLRRLQRLEPAVAAIEAVQEAVGKDYVIMWRQKASDVVFPDDVETIRRDLEEGRKQLQGYHSGGSGSIKAVVPTPLPNAPSGSQASATTLSNDRKSPSTIQIHHSHAPLIGPICYSTQSRNVYSVSTSAAKGQPVTQAQSLFQSLDQAVNSANSAPGPTAKKP